MSRYAPVRQVRFEIFRGRDDQFYARCVSRNGRILMSSEGYRTKRGALGAVEAIRDTASTAELTVDDIGFSWRRYKDLPTTVAKIRAMSKDGWTLRQIAKHGRLKTRDGNPLCDQHIRQGMIQAVPVNVMDQTEEAG